MNPLPANFPTELDALSHQKAAEFARRFLFDFYDEYRMGHLVLAAYAAVPAVLTPDLMFKLWLNFGQYHWGGQPYSIHRVAAADVLNSTLVERIGAEQFVMAAPLRKAFIEWHQKDKERLGMADLMDVARFLLQFLEKTEGLSARHGKRFDEAQRLAARSLTEPDAVARELRNRLAAGSASKSERLHAAAALQQMDERLTAFLGKNAAAKPADLTQTLLFSKAVEQAIYRQSGDFAELLRENPGLASNLSDHEVPDSFIIKVPLSMAGKAGEAREQAARPVVEEAPVEVAEEEEEVLLDVVVSKSSQPGDAFLWDMAWLERGRLVSWAVGRLMVGNEFASSCFLLEGGMVVIARNLGSLNSENARVEFGGEQPVAYEVDSLIPGPNGSPFWLVSVIDQNDNPLDQWGHLEIEVNSLPFPGDLAPIIHFPRGNEKRLSLFNGQIKTIADNRLFYSTETEWGSQDSPVFNLDWKVIGLHSGRGSFRPVGQSGPLECGNGFWGGTFKPILKNPERKVLPSIRLPNEIPQQQEVMWGDTESHLEKQTSFPINWFDRALAAARSVCRIVREDGEMGTGFLVEGGRLLTCNHTLPDKKAIETTRAEFLFDKRTDGSTGQPLTFQLDAEDFVASPTDQLNFTMVRVVDTAGQLGSLGFLQADVAGRQLEEGEPLLLIQHALGQDKKVSLAAFRGAEEGRLFYERVSKPGSSGGPVLDGEFRVVAMQEGARNRGGEWGEVSFGRGIGGILRRIKEDKQAAEAEEIRQKEAQARLSAVAAPQQYETEEKDEAVYPREPNKERSKEKHPPITATQQPLSEVKTGDLTRKQLDDLLWAMQKGRCNLVVGPLAVCDTDGRPLQKILANELAEKAFQKSGRRVAIPDNLAFASTAYQQDFGALRLLSFVEDFYKKQEDFYKKHQAQFDMWRVIASLPFSLILSASPEGNIEWAFRANFREHQVGHYSQRRDNEEVLYPNGPTVIYKIAGDVRNPNSMVFTLLDQRRHLDSIRRSDPPLPQTVQKQLFNSSNIFMGFDLEDNWSRELVYWVLDSTREKGLPVLILPAGGLGAVSDTTREAFTLQYAVNFIDQPELEFFIQLYSSLDSAVLREEAEARRINVLYMYDVADQTFKDEFDKHFAQLRRNSAISSWDEVMTAPGMAPDEQAAEQLDRANLVLMLVSADLLANNQLYEQQLLRAMDRYREGKALVCPVLVRPCLWEGIVFAKLPTVLPRNKRTVAEWEDRDSALRHVTQQLEGLVERLLENLKT